MLIAVLGVIGNYYRYRFVPMVKVGTPERIQYKNIEGYSDQLSYNRLDTVKLKLRALSAGKGIVYQLLGNGNKTAIDTFKIEPIDQKIDSTQSEYGCKWETTHTLPLTNNYQSGYYQIDLLNEKDSSAINFIIANKSTSKVVVLAPISTWVAYNDWGGKSLYVNNYESKTVYTVAAQRPNSMAISPIESHIVNFFSEYYDADLLPDYYLEEHPEAMMQYDVIVLAYHAEYFTQKMVDHLTSLVQNGHKSLISLGGNQMYWKTKWNADYTIMECRKDLTSFEESLFDYGGMWRHHLNQSEHHLLGVRYSVEGIHTYAPYRVSSPDHWIYANTHVNESTLFGKTGITSRGISGDETDKIVKLKSNMTVLAKGQNCEENVSGKDLNDCIQASGADFVITEYDGHCVLSTGSIESGAGLITDSVFTTMIHNFMTRILKH